MNTVNHHRLCASKNKMLNCVVLVDKKGWKGNQTLVPKAQVKKNV